MPVIKSDDFTLRKYVKREATRTGWNLSLNCDVPVSVLVRYLRLLEIAQLSGDTNLVQFLLTAMEFKQ